jgi:site-specific DNA recombinase
MDLLEQVVWTEIMRLLEDPALIQSELNRRVDAARTASPDKHDQQESLGRELTRVQKQMERLLTAYQEDLLSLDELRHRMPEMRRREQHLHAEIQSMSSRLADQTAYLRLAHTLSERP